jgi:hypothetical protein
MNKAHFQTMFSSISGNVYRFVGSVTEGENPIAVITEKFIISAGVNSISTVVVQTKGMYVLYSNLLDLVESDDFQFITDLTPDPIIEISDPVEEPVVEEQVGDE